jgi:hypothetical protein
MRGVLDRVVKRKVRRVWDVMPLLRRSGGVDLWVCCISSSSSRKRKRKKMLMMMIM